MRIALVSKPGHFDSGVGRYTRELEHILLSQGYEVVCVHPIVPLPQWLLKFIRYLTGWDLWEFLNNYPIWIRYPEADIYHLTSQNLATIVHFRRLPGHTVITVNDLIPWTLRNDSRSKVHLNKIHILFDWLALKGVGRVEWVITNSYKTADVLIMELNGRQSMIKTMYLRPD